MMFKFNYKRKFGFYQHGLTLVELLISLALSAVLMAGVTQVFVGMRQVDRTQEELSRMQEAGRFALNFLTQEIRVAGYMGCSSTLPSASINSTLAAGVPASFQPLLGFAGNPGWVGIQGWEASGSAPNNALPSIVDEALLTASGSGGVGWTTSFGNNLDSTKVVSSTDIIRVWSAAGAGTGAVIEGKVVGLGSANITVTNMSLNAGDMLMVSDCNFADVVQSCSSAASGGNLVLALSVPGAGCSPGNVAAATLRVSLVNNPTAIKLGGIIFYIGKRGDVASNPPALFQRILGTDGKASTAQELVEGIEDMQIVYGENSGGVNDPMNVADYYVPANQVVNWENVVSVRVSLLVQSIADNLVPAPQSYFFNGINYNGSIGAGFGALPPDRRLRRVFTSTISLRNRALGN